MKRFKGFTLTELMVALAVIGILVAVVTPAIMRTRPNKNKMMIKKTYYTTENIVNSLINDSALYRDMTEYCRSNGPAENTTQGEYCAYGFEWDEEVEQDGEKYSGNNKFQQLFASKLNIATSDSDLKTFTTTDGVYWDFTNIQTGWSDGKTNKPSNNIRTLSIDVNGTAQGPNCYEALCADKDDFDMFRIDIQSNGKMKINAEDVKASEFVTINSSVTH